MHRISPCENRALSISGANLLPAVLEFFFFNDTATTEIYTLSLHDALPISRDSARQVRVAEHGHAAHIHFLVQPDRKSTRLNSSHLVISYAVFCLKKKNFFLRILDDHLKANAFSDSFQFT